MLGAKSEFVEETRQQDQDGYIKNPTLEGAAERICRWAIMPHVVGPEGTTPETHRRALIGSCDSL